MRPDPQVQSQHRGTAEEYGNNLNAAVKRRAQEGGAQADDGSQMQAAQNYAEPTQDGRTLAAGQGVQPGPGIKTTVSPGWTVWPAAMGTMPSAQTAEEMIAESCVG